MGRGDSERPSLASLSVRVSGARSAVLPPARRVLCLVLTARGFSFLPGFEQFDARFILASLTWPQAKGWSLVFSRLRNAPSPGGLWCVTHSPAGGWPLWVGWRYGCGFCGHPGFEPGIWPEPQPLPALCPPLLGISPHPPSLVKFFVFGRIDVLKVVPLTPGF